MKQKKAWAPHSVKGDNNKVNSKYETLLKEINDLYGYLWDPIIYGTGKLSPKELWEEHVKIRRKISAISSHQGCAQVNDTNYSRDRYLQPFIEWTNKMDIKWDVVAVRYNAEERSFSLETSKQVDRGENILQVPRKAIFSWDCARQSEILQDCFKWHAVIRSMEHIALAIYLCCEQLNPKSPWTDYFNILPRSYNTPLFYSESEFLALTPSPVFEESLIFYRNISRQFISFLREIAFDCQFYPRNKRDGSEGLFRCSLFRRGPFTVDNFTFDLYRWAVSALSTRMNLIPSAVVSKQDNEPLMIPALIPVFDLANHHHAARASLADFVIYSAVSECAELIAIKDYKYNEVVNIYYGDRANSEFFIHNGFIPEVPEAASFYSLKMGLPKRFSGKHKLLEKLSISGDGSTFYFRLSRELDMSAVLNFAKVFVDEQINVEEDRLEALDDVKNVKKAWQFLSDRFMLLHSAYKDCVDEQISPLPSRRLMINRLKNFEKSILEKAKRYCDEQVSLFKEENEERSSRLVANPSRTKM